LLPHEHELGLGWLLLVWKEKDLWFGEEFLQEGSVKWRRGKC